MFYTKRRKIALIIFFVGLCIFFYPTASNYIANKQYQKVIIEYESAVSRLEYEEIDALKRATIEYNRMLAETEPYLLEPYLDGGQDGSTADFGYYDLLHIGPAIGSVFIPSIDVSLPIYLGTSDDILLKGVGHLENSSLPSSNLGTHALLTAHRGLPSAKLFRELDKLEIGDVFYIQVIDEKIEYRVTETQVVQPDDTDWFYISPLHNKVTLITCDPYMINSHRLLVTGELTAVEEII